MSPFQIGSRSSVYSPESSVRKTGSYIYEEFMPTDGTDVKVLNNLPSFLPKDSINLLILIKIEQRFVFLHDHFKCKFSIFREAATFILCMFVLLQVYTVGPDYAHAEARKSPALDGKVERDSEGKEIRYPVMLTAMEKLVARKVCLAFKVR